MTEPILIPLFIRMAKEPPLTRVAIFPSFVITGSISNTTDAFTLRCSIIIFLTTEV